MAVIPSSICYTRGFHTSLDPARVVLGPAFDGKRSRRRETLNSVVSISSGTKSGRGLMKVMLLQGDKRVVGSVWELSASEEQLRALGSYFGRLHGVDGGGKKGLKKMEVIDTGQFAAKKELELLDAYFQKAEEDTNMNKRPLSSFDEEHEGEFVFTSSPLEDWDRDDDKRPIRLEKLNDMIPTSTSKTTQLQEDEICDLYLISALVSVNIAVFLFEIASPVKNSGLQLFSLPSLYGAKINQLILVGEWWRLLTPMFLHSGVFHVALSCWVLLTFGCQVCRDYGPFTFFLIYVLGGVSGNFTSFLHTPEPTVGGTGPVFAMIGAWLSYQFQNRGATAKDVADNMFVKAIIVAVISSILSNTGPIDEWSHTGAAFSGMLYGFLTCPTVKVDEAASSSTTTITTSRRGQKEGIRLVRNYGDSWKSFGLFVLFVLGFSGLVFFVQPPLTTLPFSDF